MRPFNGILKIVPLPTFARTIFHVKTAGSCQYRRTSFRLARDFWHFNHET